MTRLADRNKQTLFTEVGPPPAQKYAQKSNESKLARHRFVGQDRVRNFGLLCIYSSIAQSAVPVWSKHTKIQINRCNGGYGDVLQGHTKLKKYYTNVNKHIT